MSIAKVAQTWRIIHAKELQKNLCNLNGGSNFFLSLHRALWNLYIVHLPTSALLLNLEKFKIYFKIHIIIAPLMCILT